MKKIILFIILPIMLCGCFDYEELSKLGIVSEIGIIYDNNQFLLRLKILNDDKSNKENISSYVVNCSGNNLSDAFNDCSKKSDVKPYYKHLETVIINDSIANYYLKDITDYFINNYDINDQFYLLVSFDNINELLKKDIDISKMINNSEEVFAKKCNDILNNKDIDIQIISLDHDEVSIGKYIKY